MFETSQVEFAKKVSQKRAAGAKLREYCRAMLTVYR